MQNKGRPCNQGEIIVEHEERPHKAQPVKEYWTEHRITLIAYQAQYIYSKKPNEFLEQKNSEGQKTKKNPRKKVNLEFQAGFLNVSPQNSEQFRVEDLVKDYENLSWLFASTVDQNYLQIKTFVKIMLELKHSIIVTEFCQIYDRIVCEIKKVNFETVEKQQSRFQWLESGKEKLIAYIMENAQKFPLMIQYLKEDEKQTKKLLLVELYCFVAEKFNFNINEFYSEAFNVPVENKSSKKIKKSS